MQRIVLRLGDTLDLLTEDDPPVALGYLSRSLASQFSTRALLRFEIGPRGIQFADTDSSDTHATAMRGVRGLPNTRMHAIDLRLIGRASKRRANADAFSKIIYQYLLRRQECCITIDMLRGAAEASPSTMDDGGEEEEEDLFSRHTPSTAYRCDDDDDICDTKIDRVEEEEDCKDAFEVTEMVVVAEV